MRGSARRPPSMQASTRRSISDNERQSASRAPTILASRPMTDPRPSKQRPASERVTASQSGSASLSTREVRDNVLGCRVDAVALTSVWLQSRAGLDRRVGIASAPTRRIPSERLEAHVHERRLDLRADPSRRLPVVSNRGKNARGDHLIAASLLLDSDPVAGVDGILVAQPEKRKPYEVEMFSMKTPPRQASRSHHRSRREHTSSEMARLRPVAMISP